MIVVTAASGHLGRLVIDQLLRNVPASQVVAAVRSPDKAKDLAARGVTVRAADYSRPETLGPALDGAEKVLLISSSEVGKRYGQHAAVVKAAQAAGVKLLAYTSLLRADTSKLALAAEHKATEEAIRASGLSFVFLRNGWYLENYTENLGPALQHGAMVGSAGTGRIAAAARADYAAAAVAVLTGAPGKPVYELAGDQRFTMAELAGEVSRQAGKAIPYQDLPADEYRAVLTGAGLPPPVADVYVDADVQAAQGALDDAGGDLRRLIGRPTTPLADAVRAALKR
ncbi:MAG: NAD(P)H-binding protein [Deltaproteobacteria bacterium]|nr:NAD(P)H-binding protein [Deltaproteobacteria bacterium]